MYANAALSIPLSSYIQDGKRGRLLRSERGSVKKKRKKRTEKKKKRSRSEEKKNKP